MDIEQKAPGEYRFSIEWDNGSGIAGRIYRLHDQQWYLQPDLKLELGGRFKTLKECERFLEALDTDCLYIDDDLTSSSSFELEHPEHGHFTGKLVREVDHWEVQIDDYELVESIFETALEAQVFLRTGAFTHAT